MAQNKHTTAVIFNTLRDRICLLDYPPGTVLREAALAKEFGISRTPIRAVLQRLEHGALVAVRDGVGTIVTDLDSTELKDIYEMRQKMAELIGVLSPREITYADEQAAIDLLGRAKRLVKDYSASEYWQINHAQHALIADLIGNAVLRETWDQLYYRSARFWYREASHAPEGVAGDLVAELSEVVRALHKRDAVAVGYTQRNFIAYGFAKLQAALSPDQPIS
ncbi:MAG: GntR family transcriptional regulator [Amylibacter sp.]|nr:GntR family transcriptional regulator [Amylibacter sp.]